MKKLLSNGNFAMNVNDFEQVMTDNDFNALMDIVNEPDTTGENWKQNFIEQEIHSDELYQRNINAYNQADEIIRYLLTCQRMNKNKLLNMLRELQNDLENY